MNIIKKAFNFCCDKARSFVNTCTEFVSSARAVVAGGVALAGTAVAKAQAVVPTEISDMVTNADTVWDSARAVIVGVVGFIILLGFVKLVKKR